jgi:hypothetical protein
MTSTTPPNNNVMPLIPANLSVIPRVEKGHFAPGGPGRPRGSRNKQSADLMRNVRAMGDRAVLVLSTALDNQERWACELVLKYVLPAGRVVEMDNLSPSEICDAFVNAELSADELKAIATSIEKLRSVESLDEMRSRLSEIEALLAANK